MLITIDNFLLLSVSVSSNQKHCLIDPQLKEGLAAQVQVPRFRIKSGKCGSLPAIPECRRESGIQEQAGQPYCQNSELQIHPTVVHKVKRD